MGEDGGLINTSEISTNRVRGRQCKMWTMFLCSMILWPDSLSDRSTPAKLLTGFMKRQDEVNDFSFKGVAGGGGSWGARDPPFVSLFLANNLQYSVAKTP